MPSPNAAADRWRVIAGSARGAAHARDDRPNQDAFAVWSAEAGAVLPCTVAAVADGHGGGRHFRSAVGAALAVKVAVRVLREHAPEFALAPEAEREQLASTELPRRLVGDWEVQARAHLAAHPIEAAELQQLEEAEGAGGVESVQADPLLIYGSTVLAALVTPLCTVLLQLGDGDVLAVSPDGTTRRPLPLDERLGGNLTTSLCRPGAEADFRCALLPAESGSGALLLLSTDGYANSFRTDADFLQVGGDFAALIRQHGLAEVEARLDGILRDASAEGSGDDITLTLLCRGAVDEARHAPAAMAAPARAAGDPVAGELAAARQRIGRLRMAVAAMSVAVAAAAAWMWRGPAPAETAEASKPTMTARPADVQVLPIHQVGGNGTTTPPPSTASDANATLEAPAPSAALEDARATRSARGIEVTARLAWAAGVDRADCVAHASISNEADQSLGAVSGAIDPSPAGPLTDLRLLVPFPQQKAQARSIREAARSASLSVECGGAPVAGVGKLAIGA